MKYAYPLSVFRVCVSNLIILAMLSLSVGPASLLRGTLVVWKNSGQLNNRADSYDAMAVDLTTTDDSELLAGNSQNCILMDDGTEECRFILFTRDPSFSSGRVKNPDPIAVASLTSMGIYQTCTLTQAGEVKYWSLEIRTGQNQDNINQLSRYAYDGLGRPEAEIDSLFKDDITALEYSAHVRFAEESGIVFGYSSGYYLLISTIIRQYATRMFFNKDKIPVNQTGEHLPRQSAPVAPLTIPTAPIGIPSEPLTPRENDVLVCIVQGKSNKEIAQKLNIARKTVEVYVYRLTRKFGVPTRVGLAVVAVMFGIVDVKYEDLQPVRINQL